jgi:RNA polymerase sigma-70 factor, ECF subfamily
MSTDHSGGNTPTPTRRPTMTLDATPSCSSARAASIPVSWNQMLSHRSYLVRFAQRRLRDPSLAEDAVHDVFEAVVSGRAAFAGRAALRSWLTAVLKHKIVDSMRRHGRFESLDDETAEHAAMPCPLPQPDELAAQRLLLARTLSRIEALPPGLRDAMRLRVLEEQTTAAVCAALGISEDNLFVRLHRARKQLLS